MRLTCAYRAPIVRLSFGGRKPWPPRFARGMRGKQFPIPAWEVHVFSVRLLLAYRVPRPPCSRNGERASFDAQIFVHRRRAVVLRPVAAINGCAPALV